MPLPLNRAAAAVKMLLWPTKELTNVHALTFIGVVITGVRYEFNVFWRKFVKKECGYNTLRSPLIFYRRLNVMYQTKPIVQQQQPSISAT